MKRIAMVTGICVICMSNGCMLDDGIEGAPALSVELSNLSYVLETKESCADKALELNKWLGGHADSLEKKKEKFDSSCLPGQNFLCMSHQILASGRVEVAVKSCLDDTILMDGIEKLNGIAGTAIGRK